MTNEQHLFLILCAIVAGLFILWIYHIIRAVLEARAAGKRPGWEAHLLLTGGLEPGYMEHLQNQGVTDIWSGDRDVDKHWSKELH